jgi:hypothetical protein
MGDDAEQSGTALQTLGKRRNDISALQAAHTAVRSAFEVVVVEGDQTHYEGYFRNRLLELEEAIATAKGMPAEAR